MRLNLAKLLPVSFDFIESNLWVFIKSNPALFTSFLERKFVIAEYFGSLCMLERPFQFRGGLGFFRKLNSSGTDIHLFCVM